MVDVKRIDDAYLWHITKIGQAFGLSRDTVRKRLTAAGISPTKTVRGMPLYPLSDVGRALFAPKKSASASHKIEELDPKSRKDFYQSENERLKFEEKTRQLIPVDEVRSDLVRVLKVNVAFFEGLPDKMERTRLFSTEQLDELERISDRLRDQLYSELVDISDE